MKETRTGATAPVVIVSATVASMILPLQKRPQLACATTQEVIELLDSTCPNLLPLTLS